MKHAREWVNRGDEPWHLRVTPRGKTRSRSTETACGVTLLASDVEIVWRGDGPPPENRCGPCRAGSDVLRAMDDVPLR